MEYSVYAILIKNVVRYVGMSINTDKRFRGHNFIKKHRNKKPVIKIIRRGLTKKEARALEEKKIIELRAQLWGGHVTYAERASNAAKVYWSKPGAIAQKSKSQAAAMRHAMKSAKKRANIKRGLAAGRTSEVHLRLWQDPVYRQKLVDAHKGRPWSAKRRQAHENRRNST